MATINDTIARILNFTPPAPGGPPGRFGYVAPFYNQAKQVAWDYVKRFSESATKKVSEGELSVTYFNNVKFTLYGADNPDSFRGLYFDGVALDEYGMMRASVWSEVLLPTLIDRQGWATFIGTPNGPNHFRDLYLAAVKDPARWFVDKLPVSQTQLIHEDELQEMKRLMLPEEYLQEMECSFEASTRGAFYATELTQADHDQRTTTAYPADPDLLLHFVFDIGRSDDTALIAFQEYPTHTTIVHAEAENMRSPQYWLTRIHTICAEHSAQRGAVWLPHDARAKTWATERSGVEQFVEGGIRPQLVPTLGVLDGINAARYVFQYVQFNAPHTDSLILALKSYHRAYNEDKKAFTNDAVHDWSSHFADAFRYFAIVAKFPHSRPLVIPPVAPTAHDPLIHYPFSLDNLWEQQDARSNRIR